MSLHTRFAYRALLVVGALSLSLPVLAQDTGSAPPPPPADQTQGPMHPHGGGDRMPDPARRAAMMGKRLNLSETQTEQLRGILTDSQAKMENLRANSSMEQGARHQAMMAIHQDENTRIDAVLTPEQRTRYAAMQQQMREHREERRDGNNAPPPPPPSSQQ